MPKYVIECRACKDSLTIIYSITEEDATKQNPFVDHLAQLMIHHLKEHPPDDDHVPVEIDLDKIKKEWIKRLKPPSP